LHSPAGEGGPLNEVEWWVRRYTEFPQNFVIALFEKLRSFWQRKKLIKRKNKE
jgi:hypothetical protein